MTEKAFAPKDAETLKAEILETTGLEYEGNEQVIDNLIAKELKDEQFKASLHADKNKHLETKKAYEERMRKAGLDPETGEKIEANVSNKSPEQMGLKDIRALQDVHDDDVDEVINFAKFKGISIADAKKHPVIKTLLQTNKEERASAEAANISSSQRGTKVHQNNIMKKVEKQEEMTDDEMKEAAVQMVNQMKNGK